MAIIRIMEESQATGRVKQVFDEIKATLRIPFVPELFRAMAFKPEQLEATWTQVKGIYGEGFIDVKTKSLVALAVAAVQRSAYFVKIHVAVLKRLGASDEEIAELLETASLSAALNTLVSGLALDPEI